MRCSRVFCTLLGLFGLVSLALPAEAQWLTFTEETGTRLVLDGVALDDGEEKDISVADFDHDGWDDVVVVRKRPFSNPGPRQDVLLMNLNGVLTDMTATYAPEFISDLTDSRDVYVDDFTGDGWEDVVIASTYHDQPKFYRNLGEDGGGNWLGLADESNARFPVLAPPGQSPPPGPLFCAVWGGDVDNANGSDIYFANYNPNGGATEDVLLMNDGTGVFTDETSTRLGNRANVAFGSGVILADMNNDGWVDIVKLSTKFGVSPWNDNGIYLLYNDGNGEFDNLPFYQYSANSPYMMTIGDLNDDDILDVYTVDDGQDRIHIATSINAGVVSYSNSNANSTRTTGFGGNVRMADMDLDGDLDVGVSPADVDIANCDGSGGEFALLRNNGTGGLSDPWPSNQDQNFHLRSHDFAFMDVNRDGCLDIFFGLCTGWALFIQDECAALAVPDVASVDAPLIASPNPFRTQVLIQHSLAGDLAGGAKVDVYDVAGRLVRSLWSGDASDVPAEFVWDGRDDRGARARPDVYFVRMSVGDRVDHAKVILVD